MPLAQQWNSALWGWGLGGGFILTIWLVVSNAWFRKALNGRMPDDDIVPMPDEPVHDFADGISEAHGKPTSFLVLYSIAFVFWVVGYVYIFMTTSHPA